MDAGAERTRQYVGIASTAGTQAADQTGRTAGWNAEGGPQGEPQGCGE